MKPMICVRGFDYEPEPGVKRKPVHCLPGDAVPGGLPPEVLRHLCSIDAIRPEGSPLDVLVGDAVNLQNPVAPPADHATGGTVQQGTPHLVGEKGPERVVPTGKAAA